MNEAAVKSTTNSQWSPTLKTTGIMHAFVTTESKVVHIPSIGFEPQKKVAPTCFPVKDPTTSFMFRPKVLVTAYLMLCQKYVHLHLHKVLSMPLLLSVFPAV